jgi:hypothetical protein
MRPEGGFTEADWSAALPWADYLTSVQDKRDVWLANDRRAKTGREAVSRLENLPGTRRGNACRWPWPATTTSRTRS